MSDKAAAREVYERMWRAFARNPKTELIDTPYRIYGKADASLWAAVDEVDYHFFIEWLWSYSMSPGGKLYIKRNTSGSAAYKNGHRIRGVQQSVYLHIEIMKRKGELPPSPAHKIVNHDDGNSLNCTRENLHWATIGENNKHRYDLARLDQLLGEK